MIGLMNTNYRCTGDGLAFLWDPNDLSCVFPIDKPIQVIFGLIFFCISMIKTTSSQKVCCCWICTNKNKYKVFKYKIKINKCNMPPFCRVSFLGLTITIYC